MRLNPLSGSGTVLVERYRLEERLSGPDPQQGSLWRGVDAMAGDLPVPEPDEAFLAAMGAGLPDCAGVALGVDRLLMKQLGAHRLADVMAFPADRA